MNLPLAVIAAMALCNDHTVATRTLNSISRDGIDSSWKQMSWDAPGAFKIPEDESTFYIFEIGYSWEPGFQEKCWKIHDYINKLELDYLGARAKAAKATEQPTLDKGIAALAEIKK